MGKLVECKSCKKQVDSTAKTCPHCGVDKPGANTKKGCLNAIVTMTAIAVIIVLANIDDKTPEQKAQEKTEQANFDCNNQSMAQVMANNFVKKMLKSPSTADFPFLADSVTQLKECTFIVKSHVDSQNSFGAVVRAQTMVKLKFNKDTESWTVIDISVN